MDFHVLVLAMSDLNAPFLVKNRDNEPVLDGRTGRKGPGPLTAPPVGRRIA